MSMFTDKTVLITGGTGSLGKVLTRRLLSGLRTAQESDHLFTR